MARLRKIYGRYYSYWYDRTKKKKSKSYPLGVTNKDAAKKLLRRLEDEYAEGKFDPWSTTPRVNGDVSYAEAAEAFIESREEKDLRPATIRNYDWFIEDCRKALKLDPRRPISVVNSDSLLPYLRKDKTVSEATRAARYRHVNVWLRWCVAEGLLEANPIDMIDGPRRHRKVRNYVRPEQVEKLLCFIEQYSPPHGPTPESQWLTDIIAVAVGTGLRRRALCHLKWEDVSLDNHQVTSRDTKSGHHHVVPVYGRAFDVLKRRAKEKAHPEYVFVGPTGRPITSDSAMQRLSRRFKFFVRKAGLPDWVRFHDLRHATISWLVGQGVPMSIVQDIAGHASITTTEGYAHLAPDAKRDAMKKVFGRTR